MSTHISVDLSIGNYFTAELEKFFRLPCIKLNVITISLKDCFYLNAHAAPENKEKGKC